MAEIVRVEGLADLQLTLQGLPIHLRDKVMYRLLRKAAAPILRAAKANAPVAARATKRVIPGLVKGTLKISTSRYWKPARGEFGVYIKPVSPSKIRRLRRTARKSGAAGPYFGDPYYYRFQEAGFHAVGRSRVEKLSRAATKINGSIRARRNQQYTAGQHRFIPGKKFIGRAWDDNKNRALDIIKSDLVAEIIAKFNQKGKNGNRRINR
jgi:hypothetical protein